MAQYKPRKAYSKKTRRTRFRRGVKRRRMSRAYIRKQVLSLAESKSLLETGEIWLDTLPNPTQARSFILGANITIGGQTNQRIGRKIQITGFRVQATFDNQQLQNYLQTLRIELIYTQRRQDPLDVYLLGNDANRTPTPYEAVAFDPYLRHITPVNTVGFKRLSTKMFYIRPTNSLGTGSQGKTINVKYYVKLKKPIIMEFEPNEASPKPQIWCVTTAANPAFDGATDCRLQGFTAVRTYFKDV